MELDCCVETNLIRFLKYENAYILNEFWINFSELVSKVVYSVVFDYSTINDGREK